MYSHVQKEIKLNQKLIGQKLQQSVSYVTMARELIIIQLWKQVADIL